MFVLYQRVEGVDVVLSFVLLENNQHGFTEVISACLVLVFDGEVVGKVFKTPLD